MILIALNSDINLKRRITNLKKCNWYKTVFILRVKDVLRKNFYDIIYFIVNRCLVLWIIYRQFRHKFEFK